VLAEYRDHPDDLHLLRIGFAGETGALANIDQEGFAACAFHSFPDTLHPDGISGDYAQNFFGHALNTATYLVHDPEYGWQAFGGNLQTTAAKITLTPLDSFRSRVYLAPRKLWMTLDAGRFSQVELTPKTGAVRIALAPATPDAPIARLRTSAAPSGSWKQERGAFVIPLGSGVTWVELK
jgi:hypothetical protein